MEILHFSALYAVRFIIFRYLCRQKTNKRGWRATMVADTDGTHYLLVSNFSGREQARIATTLQGRRLTMDISLEQNHSATYKVVLKKRKVRVFPIRN